MDVIDELAAAVGAAHVLTGDRAAGYETDWTRRFSGPSRCVVRPGDTDEAAAVVAVCARHGLAVVPQGGNTGLVGGGVPRDGEVILSLGRLDDVEAADPDAATIVAGAGATLAAVQAGAAKADLAFGVDLAPRESATIGGMIATNAGGLQVVRHGSMRRQVLGVEAVLADGRVLRRMAALPKDSTGYDVPGLFVGSEGTLGIVTRAALRLVPRPRHRAAALLALPDVAAAVAAAARLRAVGSLESLELLTDDALRLVADHLGVGAPVDAAGAGAWVLVACAGPNDPIDELAEAVADVDPIDAAVATERPDRERLWAYREQVPDAVAAAGVPVKLDVAVPLRALAAFCAELPGIVASVDARARSVVFGHLAEGNLHVNVIGAESYEAVEDAVLAAVLDRGGSISSEHGVGIAKRRFLDRARDPADVTAMRAIKTALDPAGLLNPGVLVPVSSQPASGP